MLFPIYTVYEVFALPLLGLIQSVHGCVHSTCPTPHGAKNISAQVLALSLALFFAHGR